MIVVEVDIHPDFEMELAPHIDDPEFRELLPKDFQTVLRERLSPLVGLESAFIEAKFRFEIDVKALPLNSIIRSGVGARTQIGSDVLRLSGGQLAIGDDDSDGGITNSLSWFVEPYTSWGYICGSIDFRGEKNLDPSLISDLCELAQNQFRRYVLQLDEPAT